MEYEEEDESVSRESYQAPDDDDDDEQPRKKGKASSTAEREDLVNEKRGYTSQERDMIAEWLKKNKPKTDTPETEEKA